MESLGDPTKLEPLIAGPGGAIVVLLLFIAYLLRELTTARAEVKANQGKYEQQLHITEQVREQRDEYRFMAGDALRAAKRSAQTAVATQVERVNAFPDRLDLESPPRRSRPATTSRPRRRAARAGESGNAP